MAVVVVHQYHNLETRGNSLSSKLQLLVLVGTCFTPYRITRKGRTATLWKLKVTLSSSSISSSSNSNSNRYKGSSILVTASTCRTNTARRGLPAMQTPMRGRLFSKNSPQADPEVHHPAPILCLTCLLTLRRARCLRLMPCLVPPPMSQTEA